MGRAWEIAFRAAALMISLPVLATWLGFDARLEPAKSAFNDYWKARVPDMIYGRAHLPFVRRTLVPTTIRVIRRTLPRFALGAIRRTVSGPPLFLPRKMGALGWEPAFLAEYVIAAALLLAVIAAFPFALRRLFLALFDAPRAAPVAALVATMLLPFLFFDRGTHYLYDFSTLVLFTLALACLALGRQASYYVVFILGTLNKETMILATLVFLVTYRGRLPTPLLLRHALAQVALFAGIQWGLGWAFAGNPGGAVEWHLVKNLRLMRAQPDAGSLLFLASGAVLVFARLRDQPAFLKGALAVVVPPLLVSYLFLGIYGEVRVFYEAYPILFLLAFKNASEACGVGLVPAQAFPMATSPS